MNNQFDQETRKILCDKLETTKKEALLPSDLIANGWLHKGLTKLEGKEFPLYDVYTKRYNDGCDDGYTYQWKLFVPSFERFGTWQGASFIIQEDKVGGFFGFEENHTTYWGLIPSLADYKYLCTLLHIK